MNKILIIDDEAGFTRLMKLTLQQAGGYEVFEENEGSKAWETARQVQPDLILLDIVMPGMDGGDVAAKIRGDSALAHIPIVFLSAIVSEKDPIPDGLIGGFPFISKPVSLDALIQCIRQHLPDAQQA